MSEPNEAFTEAVYKEKARQAEWHQDTFGPATRMGRGRWESAQWALEPVG